MQRLVTTIKNQNGIIAQCVTHVRDNVGFINSLKVIPEFRKQKFGSTLLKSAEIGLYQQHNVKQIRLLAWQPQGEILSNFFEKNNYNIFNDFPYNNYDDGEQIYDLVHMYKNMPEKGIILTKTAIPPEFYLVSA